MNSRGLKYPSVTEILSPYIDKQWFTDESRDRGSAVHVAISAHLQGLYMVPLAPDHQPYFDSARRWIDMVVDQVIMVETRLYDDRLKYCGKLDLICIIRGDDFETLVDLKTGAANQLAWQLQVQTYRRLYMNVKNRFTRRGLSLRAKSDGSGCLPVAEYATDLTQDFNIFAGLLNAHKFFKPKKEV